jgi:micrococcal nuclease
MLMDDIEKRWRDMRRVDVSMFLICATSMLALFWGATYLGRHTPDADEPQVISLAPGKVPFFVYRAKVLRVIDGDTLQMHVDRGHDDYSIRIVRLLNIDCPEKNQPGGSEATEFTRQWTGSNRLLVRSDQEDSFGRWLVVVEKESGENLADALRTAGHVKQIKEVP